MTLVGVPGIGKSRLVRELLEHATDDAEPVAWLQGRCLPYGDGVSFWAIAEMIRARAGVLETDTNRVVEEKLAGAVRTAMGSCSSSRRSSSRSAATRCCSGGKFPAGVVVLIFVH